MSSQLRGREYSVVAGSRLKLSAEHLHRCFRTNCSFLVQKFSCRLF